MGSWMEEFLTFVYKFPIEQIMINKQIDENTSSFMAKLPF